MVRQTPGFGPFSRASGGNGTGEVLFHADCLYPWKLATGQNGAYMLITL